VGEVVAGISFNDACFNVTSGGDAGLNGKGVLFSLFWLLIVRFSVSFYDASFKVTVGSGVGNKAFSFWTTERCGARSFGEAMGFVIFIETGFKVTAQKGSVLAGGNAFSFGMCTLFLSGVVRKGGNTMGISTFFHDGNMGFNLTNGDASEGFKLTQGQGSVEGWVNALMDFNLTSG